MKDGKYRLAPEGTTLIERATADPNEARRMLMEIKLRDIAGYVEMLRLLSEGSRTFDEIDSALKAALKAEWKSKNQSFFRLNWLRSMGYAEKEGRSYQLTATGQALAGGLAPSEGAQEHDARIETLPPTEKLQDALITKATELADALEEAAHCGKDGADLERSTCDAFCFLGFHCELVSGPGNPDVVVDAPMGEAGYRVLIDTKSRSGGVVQQGDVNFNALNDHKAKFNADHVAVLGADFSTGNLEKWAEENKVRLLRTEELRQVLLAHAEGIIAMDRLEALFAGGGPTDEEVFSEILAESEHAAQAMSLARVLYNAVRTHQDKEGALNAHSLFYVLGGEYSIPAIQATIDLLKSDLLGALAEAGNGSLYTRLTPKMLRDKLAQLKNIVGGGEGMVPAAESA
jgi:hypothetical protein